MMNGEIRPGRGRLVMVCFSGCVGHAEKKAKCLGGTAARLIVVSQGGLGNGGPWVGDQTTCSADERSRV